MKKKNILVVDDSALMRRVLSDIINSDERFTVCDIAHNGLEAFDKVTLDPKKYDAVVLDINMPKMNGIEFLEQLDRLRIRITVIIVSTVAKQGAVETIRALELGAFDFVTKPGNFIEAKGESFHDKVLNCLACATKLANGAEHLQVRTRKKNESDTGKEEVKTSITSSRTGVVARRHSHKQVSVGAKKLVALACSTGGPKALQQVIPKLPENLDAPVVMVQHMPAGFTASLASRLNDLSKVNVKEAVQGDVLQKGTVYIAPGGTQMRVVKKGRDYTIALFPDEPARTGLKPCADIMYESLVTSDFDDITCVVLTGMGGDGTAGIKQLNEKKNIYVIGQNAETCTVYGMPKVLFESGLTDEVVPLDQVADSITKNVGVR